MEGAGLHADNTPQDMPLHDMTSSSRQLSRFTAIFAGGTMVSRVLGLVRDMAVAAYVSTVNRDAFLLAFRLPNMLRDLVGEGAMNAAFVPVLSETLERRSARAFRELVGSALTVMLCVLAALTFVGTVFAPLMLQGLNALRPITGGEELTPENLALIVSLTRWVFPYLFFIGIAVFAMSPLFAVRHYATPSWSPALLNISLLVCLFLLGKRFSNSAYALVAGVWLGGITQVLALYFAMGKHTGVWRPNLRLGDPGLARMFSLIVPVMLGQATGEVNKLVDALFAASLGKGTVSALFYANRLVQLPLSVFGFATAAAILPSVSRAAALHDVTEVRSNVMHGLRQSFFLVLPSMFGLMVLARPVVSLLFERRAFGAEEADRTAIALMYYSAGLLSFTWVKVTVSGFYGMQDTKTPVIVASASMLLNIALNCALVRPLGYKGLALATTISYTVNFVVLYVVFSERLGKLWDGPFLTALVRMFATAMMMAAVTKAAHVRTVHVFQGSGLSDRLACATIPIAVALLSYCVLSWFLGVEELRDFLAILRRRKD